MKDQSPEMYIQKYGYPKTAQDLQRAMEWCIPADSRGFSSRVDEIGAPFVSFSCGYVMDDPDVSEKMAAEKIAERLFDTFVLLYKERAAASSVIKWRLVPTFCVQKSNIYDHDECKIRMRFLISEECIGTMVM